MMENLSLKQRQMLALAILALLLVTIAALTVVPLLAVNRHYLDNIDDLDSRLQILQRTVSTSDGLRSQHEQLKRSMASNRHYLKGNSDALAAANLQAVIKLTASSRGMDIISTQILPAREEEGFTRVTLKVRMRGQLENAVKVFHALEAGQPYLFLDNISLRNFSRRQTKTNVTAANLLNIDFDLIGYMLPQS